METDYNKTIAPTEEWDKRVREAFRQSTGVVDHEFPQSVIDDSADIIKDIIESIASGESTFEEVDAYLMSLWKQLKAKNSL